MSEFQINSNISAFCYTHDMKKYLIIILPFLYSLQAISGLIPIAARYDGAGSIYGAGYQTKLGSYDLLLGGVTGDASAYGVLVTKHFNKDLEVSLGALSFDNVSLLTTYNRNLQSDEDQQYLLNIKGNAIAAGLKWWLFSDMITLKTSVTQSTVQFDSYQDEDENEIDLAGANLFDVETLNIKTGLDFNFYDNAKAPSKGFGLNTSISKVSGRTGQSDQTILEYGATALVPIYTHFSLLFKAKFSDAIVKVNSSYDTDAEVRAALNANCSSVTDASKRTKCQNLENELVAYILQNNLRGTATPIGGSGGLRSFREQRFKATHTALYSAEFKTNLSSLFNILNSKGSRLELNLFYDQAYANDDKLKLLDESKFSNGAAIQIIKNSNAIKLQVASGSDDSNSWSLSFGKAF
jgi:hypothetical protein